MPRIARTLLGNIFIHNMVQGINKEFIFETEYQKNKYLTLIRKYSIKYKILIIAYCIMDNHAHILTYSQDINKLSLFMKEMNTEYAQFYNRTQNRVGYVFRNRFASKPICSQDQLLKCIKYIHMNPVKAKLTQKEEDYLFSSYNKYLNLNLKENYKILEIIFNSNTDYLKKFYSIKYESLNFEKEKINLEDCLNEFLSKNNFKSNEISKNNIILKKFITYLISNEYKFTKKELAKILNISRTDLYRKLKKGDDKK